VSDPLLYTPPGCVLYLDLRKPDGEYLRDYSGHGNHGVIHGARLEHRHPLWGLSFDGVDDYVEVHDPNGVLAFTGDFTISLLFARDDETGTWKTLVEYNRGGTNWYGMWISPTGKFHINLRGSVITCKYCELNRWYHFVGVYSKVDPSHYNAKMFVDGVLIAEATVERTLEKRPDKLTIGLNCDHEEPYPGYILLVRIYNRALSGEEIKRCFESIEQRILRRVVGHVL